MIKLIHIADIHLGMENYGRVDKKTGLHSRLTDFLKCLDYCVDYALEQKADFFLFAGDAFKTRDPSPTYQREFAKRIKKVASAGINTILVIGNHDLPNAFKKADTLEIYKTLGVENVYVSRQPEVLDFIKNENNKWEFNNDNQNNKKKFQIATLPWIPKSDFLQDEKYKGKTITEAYEMMSKEMITYIDKVKEKTSNDNPAALIAHGTVAGATFGGEQKTYIGTDILLPLNIVGAKPFNYVALGHLHRHQVLSENPPVIYSGSIERVDFGEEKEEKGFVGINIDEDTQKTDYKFIETPSRRFLTIKVDIKESDLEPNKKIIEEVKKHDLKDAVVKVKINLPENMITTIHDGEIRQALSDANFVAGIIKDTEKTERENLLENVEGMSVRDALGEYGKAKGVDIKRVELLKKYTEKMMEE
ncbi:MAG: exonuclease subunit SbcD [Parcubacteria group bacterium]|nr:exonuclease subunit SbcD [Parcubacteria group bacterium]